MPADTEPTRPALYLVACAAPPARDVGDLVALIQNVGWTVCLTATPRVADAWIDADALSRQTGYPVRSQYKRPGDPDVLPPPTRSSSPRPPSTPSTNGRTAPATTSPWASSTKPSACGSRSSSRRTPKRRLPPIPRSAAASPRSPNAVSPSPRTKPSGPPHPDKPFHWAPILDALLALPRSAT
jgi:hypothetical protein